MRTYIIAEMAWAHDGSLNKAIKIMKEAKKAGADAISIHITDMENYMVPYYGRGESKVSAGRENLDIFKYLKEINLSFNNWEEFADEAKKENIDLCIMPNDEKSFDFSRKKIKPQSYAISAACFVEKDFLQAIARTQKKTFFRIGGTTLGEIEQAVNIFRKCKNNNIVLLQGIQLYPTKLEQTNLSMLSNLKSIFNTEVGLADHLDGGEPLAKIIPLLAIPYGASYIEKHITLNRLEKGEDFESALNPNDFMEFVNFVRASEIAIGMGYFSDLNESQLKYRNICRKRIIAVKNIDKGKILEESDVIFKRCDSGLTPDKLEMILGRQTKKNISKNDVLILGVNI